MIHPETQSRPRNSGLQTITNRHAAQPLSGMRRCSRGAALVLAILAALHFGAGTATGQSVGLNNATPDASSILDLTATDRGLLIPRMLEAEKNAIGLPGNPATGLLVYQTDGTAGFYFYSGSAWVALSSADDGDWVVSGTDMYSALSGDVGIGTTNPTSKLHIYGTSNNAADIVSETDAARIVKHWFKNANRNWSIGQIGSTQSPNYSFQITDETAGAIRMAIKTDGNVGIGTGSPSQKLDVVGNAEVNGYITASGGIRTGGVASPGTYELYVVGQGYISSYLQVSDYVAASGGIHVGGTSDPGIDNLLVDGNTRTSTFTMLPGAIAGRVLSTDAFGNGTWVDPNLLGGDNLGDHTATGDLNMNQQNIDGVNMININDVGQDEGILWNGSAAKIYVAPLTGGNADGYLRLINDGGIVFEPGAEGTPAVTFASNGNVGIGTISPDAHLEVVSTSTSSPRGILNTQYDNGTSAPQIWMRKARGTESSPSSVIQSDVLGNLVFAGYGTSFDDGPRIRGFANQTWTGTAHGSYLIFETVADGSTSQSERMRIAADGKVSLTSGTEINEFSTDGALGDNSDDALPTEQAVKTYVDAQVSTINTTIGSISIDDLTDGSDGLGTQNVFLGSSSGAANVSGGNYNVGLGLSSLQSLTTGDYNSAVGYLSLNSNSTGSRNNAFGYNSMYYATTGNDYNSAFGNEAMKGTAAYTNSDYNTAVGSEALYSINGADYNTAIGRRSLYSTTLGNGNTASGYYSMYSNTTGIYNTASGYYSMYNATTGNDYNIAIGQYAMRGPAAYTNSDYNIAVGTYALYSIDGTVSGGDYNIAMGYYSMYDNTTGTYNTASGYYAMRYATTGNDYNVAMGRNAMRGPNAGYTNSDYNIALGDYALSSIDGGDNNVAVGRNSMVLNTTGGNNTAVGYFSMYNSTTGNDYNVAMGRYAMRGTTAGYTNSDYNTAVGDYSLYSINGSDNNAGVGKNSLYAVTSGNGNIGMGSYSGDNITTGSYNIMLGYDIDAPTATASNQLNIGNLIYGTDLDGRDATLSSGNIGIGTTTPTSRLEVKGSGSTSATNSFLVENSAGTDIFKIRDDGRVGIGTSPSTNYQLYNLVPSTSTADYAQRNYFYRSSTEAGTMYGLYNYASRASTGVAGSVYGVYSQAYNNVGTATTFGTRGYASGNSTGIKYGIYSSTGGSGTRYAGYFVGDVYCSGTYLPSDESLKKNISNFDNALSKVNAITVKEYEYIHEGDLSKMDLPKGRQVGIMAQDLENVFPQLTKDSEFDLNDDPENEDPNREENILKFQVVNYTGLVPVLVKAMQEQQEQIASLESALKSQQQVIAALQEK